MPQKNPKDYIPLEQILALRGMVIDSTLTDKESKIITITLNRDKRFKISYCSCCGSKAGRESRVRRTIRDLPVVDYRLLLDCELFIVNCSKCGRVREKLDFIDNYSRFTKRFELFIFELVSMSTVKDVATKFNMSWETVKNIDKKYLEAKFSNINYGDLEYIGIDEIANKKGHDYLTVVLNLITGQVIWVGEGRKTEDLDKFFETLTQDQKDKIKAVSIDMWPAFINSAKKNCPNADIVFDKFHVVKKYGEVIIKLRSSEYAKAAKDGNKNDKQVLKGTKWLLLRNKTNLTKDKKTELKELLELNENLATAYILKEKLSNIWNYKNIAWAKKSINSWVNLAEKSEIRGIKSFIKMLKKHEYGILSHCKYPISNGIVEGTNNKIKVLKRRCYGFHDVEYFKLKILEACQGKTKSTAKSENFQNTTSLFPS